MFSSNRRVKLSKCVTRESENNKNLRGEGGIGRRHLSSGKSSHFLSFIKMGMLTLASCEWARPFPVAPSGEKVYRVLDAVKDQEHTQNRRNAGVPILDFGA